MLLCLLTRPSQTPLVCLTSEWLLWILGPCSCHHLVLAITTLPTPQPPSNGCVACTHMYRDPMQLCPRCLRTWNPAHHQHQAAEAVHLPDLQQRQVRGHLYEEESSWEVAVKGGCLRPQRSSAQKLTAAGGLLGTHIYHIHCPPWKCSFLSLAVTPAVRCTLIGCRKGQQVWGLRRQNFLQHPGLV